MTEMIERSYTISPTAFLMNSPTPSDAIPATTTPSESPRPSTPEAILTVEMSPTKDVLDEYVLVPSFDKGSSMDDSIQILTDLGLETSIVLEYSDFFEKDMVMYTIPDAGVLVRKGECILLGVSLGKEIQYVPNVIGKTIGEAHALLHENYYFSTTIGWDCSLEGGYSDDEIVLWQWPRANEIVGEESLIVMAYGRNDDRVIVTADGKMEISGRKFVQESDFVRYLTEYDLEWSEDSEGFLHPIE